MKFILSAHGGSRRGVAGGLPGQNPSFLVAQSRGREYGLGTAAVNTRVLIFWGLFLCAGMPWLTGCTVVKATGKVASVVGKAGYHTARVAGKTVVVVGKASGGAAKTAVHVARGNQVVPLERRGGLVAEVTVNRRTKARFLVDTGAEQMQISQSLARRLKMDLRRAEPVSVRVAGGTAVAARAVMLKEVRIGRARVENVQAIVIDREGAMDYDGLLGMSFLSHFNFQVDTQNARLILRKRM
ncbi:MAG: retropepsin-like aspartic protease [Candidatus Omnitrophota bacterium]